MTRKLKKHTLKILFAVMLVPFLALAALYIWVIQQPRSLSDYIPQIEKSIEDEVHGYDIKIASADLHWGGLGDFLNIRLGNVDIADSKNVKIARIPAVELDFKVLPLLIGQLVPANFSVSKTTALVGNQIIKIAQFDVDFRGDNASFLGTLNYDSKPFVVRGSASLGQEKNKVTIYADRTNLKNFAKLSPYLEKADLLLDLKSELVFTNHKLTNIAVNATNISGSYLNTDNEKDAIRVDNGVISALLALDEPSFKLSDLSLNFDDGVKISVNAEGKAENDFDLNAKIDGMNVKNLYKYWPRGISENANSWIKDAVLNGQISNAEAKIEMRPWYSDAETGSTTIPPEAVAAKFDFKNVTVKYVDGLPIVTQGHGRAEMNATTLNFYVDGGDIDGSKITDTHIKIDGIGVLPVEELTMTGNVEGNPATLIAFYERAHPKDAIVRAKDIKGGTAKTYAELRFPLDKDLLLIDIGIVLNAEISGANAKGMESGAELSNFNGKISMDDKGYQLTGSVNAQPNIEKDSVKTGNIPLSFDVSEKDKIEQYNLNADVTDVEFNFKDLNIKKPKGDKAKFEVTARKKDEIADIQTFKFTSDALRAEGEGALKKDLSDFISLNFYTLSFGKSVLSGKVTHDNGYKIYMKGNYFDASPLLAEDDDKKPKKKDRTKPPLYVELKFNELGLVNNQILKNPSITVACVRDDCDEVRVVSDQLQVNINKKTISISSSDAGKILSGFDVFEDMRGGEMLLQGDSSKVGDNSRYVGHVKIANFKIVNSEFLVGLLRLGSLTGILDILQGQGISFDKLAADFDYESDTMLKISNARMKGNSIGGTTDGTINLATDALDFQGKIIPAYSANTILGEVPVLGELLIGDDGIFALAYTVKGTIDEPDQTVNPLSVLAPGFMQKVFE